MFDKNFSGVNTVRLTIRGSTTRYGAAAVDTKGRKRIMWSDPEHGLQLVTFSHGDTLGTIHGSSSDFDGLMMFKSNFVSNQWPIPNSYEHIVGQWSGQLGHLNITTTSSNGFVIRSNNWEMNNLNYYVACEIKHINNGVLNVTTQDLGMREVIILIDVDSNTMQIEPNWEPHQRYYFHPGKNNYFSVKENESLR